MRPKVFLEEGKESVAKAHAQRSPVSALQPFKARDPAVSLLHLQRALGNRHVQRLLGSGTVQTKLAISQPGDPFEMEAERVAETVMRLLEPDTTNSAAIAARNAGPQIQRECAHCEEELARQVMDEEEESLQGKSIVQRRIGAGDGQTLEAAPLVDNVLRSPGHPLDSGVRGLMESSFGHDFSQVRVHTGAEAAESARSVNARAYTVGRDIVFGVGEYAPATATGKRLLAHELTHVIQQSGGASAVALQRAETDTSKNCAPLTDTKTDVNDKINAALGNARKRAGKPLDAEKVIDGVSSELAKNTSIGRTAIEDWAGALGAKKVDLPAQSATKYKGVSYRLWIQSGFPILNPTMKVSGICIGSDKLGHFLQQGFEYYEIARRVKGGKVAAAEEFGERTEGGGFGLGSTGVFSNADLEANRQGLKFYDDVKADPSLAFDITNYISDKWNEETNASFYESSVAEHVWSNLLSRTWNGEIDFRGSAKAPAKLDLKATTSGVVTGTYEYTGAKGKTVKGVIKNGKVSFDKKTVKGESLFGNPTTETPVSAVTIDFEWEEGAAKGLGKLMSKGESRLEGTWGLDKSATNGGNWEFT